MEISYDLSSDVAMVALGIDNHLNKRATNRDYDRIKELSDKLDEDSKEDFLDPTMQGMYANLFWKNKKDWIGKKQRDVQEEISNFSEELSLLTKLPKDRQEYLKTTCLELSRGIMWVIDERYGGYRRGLAA